MAESNELGGNPLVKLSGIAINHFRDQTTGQLVRWCQLHCVMLDESPDTFQPGDISDQTGSRVLGFPVAKFTCPRNVDPRDLKTGELYHLVFQISLQGKKPVATLQKLVPVPDSYPNKGD